MYQRSRFTVLSPCPPRTWAPTRPRERRATVRPW